MSLKNALVLAMVLGLAGCEGRVEGQAVAARAPGAASARACVEGLLGSMTKDDMVGAAAYFTEPVRGQLGRMATGMAAVTAAQEKLAAAVNAKFGAGAAEKAGIERKHRDTVNHVEIVEVKETGDTATARTREGKTEDTLQLVKQGGAWFVSPPKDDPEFGEATFAEVDARLPKILAQAKEIDAVAADVAAGKVKQDEVEKKYREAIRKAMGN